MMSNRRERIARRLFTTAGWLSAAVVGVICLFLLVEALPALTGISPRSFFGWIWSPARELWGILPMLWGSFIVTVTALALGLPLGLLTAILFACFCPRRAARPLAAAADLLAGIPSVVYGFFGLSLLVPAVRVLFGGSGMSALTAGLLLGIMILPTILSLSRTALEGVDGALYRGARALGASHAGAVFSVVLPAARQGIRSAALLGLGRAVGETMAVMMVAGNQARLPAGLLDGIRTLSTGIVIEMGYAAGLHRSALILLALVLFAAILVLNLFLVRDSPQASRSARTVRGEGKYLSVLVYAAGSLTAGALLAILAFIVLRGAPYLGEALPGLAAPVVTTLCMLLLALMLALPLGVAAAVYLGEYARAGRGTALLRVTVQTLAGIPSVVWGLFGMLFFVIRLGWGYSILAGSVTLALMILPLIQRTAEEALHSVDVGLRRGSAALGAGKLRTLACILLPGSARGILAGVLLAVGRMVGETAALLYTAGSVAQIPDSLFASGRTLAVHMYALAGEGLYTDQAYATALVLLIIILVLNAAGYLLGRSIEARGKGSR